MNFRNYSKFSICYGKYFISHDYSLFFLTCDWAMVTINKDVDINWFWTWNNKKCKCILTWKFSFKNFIMKKGMEISIDVNASDSGISIANTNLHCYKSQID